MSEQAIHSLPENAYQPLKPGESYRPLMDAAKQAPELTARAILWGVLFCVVFTVASAYSTLKVGQGMEAAIPISILTIGLARHHGADAEREHGLVTRLEELPALIERALSLDPAIHRLAERFADKRHTLFLGRGALYPIAMEGALKLKEISYIHAESYPAGELKHGPLALVDADMPVIAVAPNNDLLEKLKSNLMEVRARGGELIVFADPEAGIQPSDGVTVIEMPKHVTWFQAPAVYSVPLQLLAYHVAVLKGTDVDQPRNLAKSVTVE